MHFAIGKTNPSSFSGVMQDSIRKCRNTTLDFAECLRQSPIYLHGLTLDRKPAFSAKGFHENYPTEVLWVIGTRSKFKHRCFLDLVKFSLPHSKRCCFRLLVGLCLEN